MSSRTIAGLGLVAAIALAGCANAPERPQAIARREPAPSAAPAPHALAAQASAFESFMRHARGIDADFSGPAEVASALQTGAAHDPKELEAGMVAYAALAALQEPRFVAAVKAGRGDLAARIGADPALALDLPGGEAAGARASGALYAEGSALNDEGQKVKHAAYTVQHQAWSKAQVTDPRGRLAGVKRISAAGYAPARDDPARLQAALSDAPRRAGQPSQVVAQGVALAALSVLGQEARGHALMSDPRAAACLKIAKLNLYQCLASAGPNYEDIFCLGQHAMIDPGQCAMDAAKAPVSRQAVVTQASYRR